MLDGDYNAQMKVETKDGRECNIHLSVMQVGFGCDKLDLCPDCSVGLLQESLKPESAQ